MTDAEFEELFENTLISIEEALEPVELLDVEVNSGGILTIEFANQSKIIINKQTPLHQLWVAAKAGGFHLNYDPITATWKTLEAQNQTSPEELFNLLARLCSEQAGQTIQLNKS